MSRVTTLAYPSLAGLGSIPALHPGPENSASNRFDQARVGRFSGTVVYPSHATSQTNMQCCTAPLRSWDNGTVFCRLASCVGACACVRDAMCASHRPYIYICNDYVYIYQWVRWMDRAGRFVGRSWDGVPLSALSKPLETPETLKTGGSAGRSNCTPNARARHPKTGLNCTLASLPGAAADADLGRSMLGIEGPGVCVQNPCCPHKPEKYQRLVTISLRGNRKTIGKRGEKRSETAGKEAKMARGLKTWETRDGSAPPVGRDRPACACAPPVQPFRENFRAATGRAGPNLGPLATGSGGVTP